MHSSQHGPSVEVYKVDCFVKSSLSSSLVFTLIQEFVLLSNSKDLRIITASFIDNVIIGTETEEGHDELVEEVVKRLAENNLYVKLEKYKQKVREVGFLGVVIGPEGIKMEEEKVKGVLDQLTPKGIKNIQKFLGLANYCH